MKHDRKLLTATDIMPLEAYTAERRKLKQQNIARKARRRMAVGPLATIYFENYDTMWHQVHEMLFIEKGGEEQLADELAAYNPMIPNGRELTATLMFEVPDEAERRKFLANLGGVERHVRIRVGDEVVKGVPEEDVERTSAEGKASSVHFLHFPFTDAALAAWADAANPVVVEIDHPGYHQKAEMPETLRDELSGDFSGAGA